MWKELPMRVSPNLGSRGTLAMRSMFDPPTTQIFGGFPSITSRGGGGLLPAGEQHAVSQRDDRTRELGISEDSGREWPDLLGVGVCGAAIHDLPVPVHIVHEEQTAWVQALLDHRQGGGV